MEEIKPEEERWLSFSYLRTGWPILLGILLGLVIGSGFGLIVLGGNFFDAFEIFSDMFGEKFSLGSILIIAFLMYVFKESTEEKKERIAEEKKEIEKHLLRTRPAKIKEFAITTAIVSGLCFVLVGVMIPLIAFILDQF